MKVLIVDDARAVRRMLSVFVQAQAGLEPVEAADGIAGLELLERHAPIAAALVDWDMPGMSGLEFVQAVRADQRWIDVKLMMVTARNSDEDLQVALAAGVDEFLMKPFTEGMVSDKLRMLGLVDAGCS